MIIIPTGALFLDDIRMPKDVYEYIKNDIYLSLNWDIVRNYNDFVQYITDTGLPDIISFDHDIADSHYTPQHLWDDYNASKKWQEEQVHTEKTGYDCAKWLVEYCLNNDLDLPFCYVHSMNPVGKDNINHLLKNYNDSRIQRAVI